MDLKRVFAAEDSETAGDVVRVVTTVVALHALLAGDKFRAPTPPGQALTGVDLWNHYVKSAREIGAEMVSQLEANP